MAAGTLIAAGADVLKQITPQTPAEAQPVIDKGVLAIGILLALGIVAAAGGVVVGIVTKRGGIVGGFEGAAHHGSSILWGSIISLVLLLGIGTVFGLIVLLAP